MKNIFTLLAAVLFTATTFAQVGINNENPDASAALDITSTTGGLLSASYDSRPSVMQLLQLPLD